MKTTPLHSRLVVRDIAVRTIVLLSLITAAVLPLKADEQCPKIVGIRLDVAVTNATKIGRTNFVQTGEFPNYYTNHVSSYFFSLDNEYELLSYGWRSNNPVFPMERFLGAHQFLFLRIYTNIYFPNGTTQTSWNTNYQYGTNVSVQITRTYPNGTANPAVYATNETHASVTWDDTYPCGEHPDESNVCTLEAPNFIATLQETFRAGFTNRFLNYDMMYPPSSTLPYQQIGMTDWIEEQSETLSGLYSAVQLISDTRQKLSGAAYPDQWSFGNSISNVPLAAISLSTNEANCTAFRARYQIQFKALPGMYRLKWRERFTPADGGAILDTEREEIVVGTGEPQYGIVHYALVPASAGTVTLEVPQVSECDICSPGADVAFNGSIDFSLSLGQARDGNSAGRLYIYASTPSNNLASLAALRGEFGYQVQVTYSGSSSNISTVAAPEILAQVLNVTPRSYEIWLHTYAATTNLENIAQWRVENPDSSGSTFTRLNIIQLSPTLVTNAYVWIATNNNWELSTGNGLRKETKVTAVEPGTGDQITTVTIRDASGQIAYVERRRLRSFPEPFGRALIELTVDPQGVNRITTYSYYTDTNSVNYGKLRLIAPATGPWTHYVYDANGQLEKEISGFGNTSPSISANESECRVTEYSYDPVDPADTGTLDPETPRTTIVKLLGEEISRTYNVILPGERRLIECPIPGAPFGYAPTNLVTITKHFVSGDQWIIGKVRSIDYPDNTREIHSYSFSPPINGARFVTNLILNGAADPLNDTNVFSGTRTSVVMRDTGRELSTGSCDIESGILLSQAVHTLDSLGRATRTDFLDGTYQEFIYTCCGLQFERTRDGDLIEYTYDDLHRRQSKHIPYLGLTHLYRYNATGDLLSEIRVGAGSANTPSSSAYDRARQLIWTTNALGNATHFTNFIDAAGQLVRTATHPDAGARIQTFYRDGSLKSVTGTAVHGVRYEYGVETNSAFTKEIRLTTDGDDTTEWQISCANAMGRTFKTVFSDNASAFSFYNAKGQLVSQIDPDGVTTLYQYNAEGDVEYTATDMNANGEIDFTDPDRVTRTISDVIASHGTNVVRTRTYAWMNDNSSKLILTEETSTDGLQTWSTIWNDGLPVTTHTQIAHDAAAGDRYVTNTAPDGSFSVTYFFQGYLWESSQWDANGTQIGQTAFYDEDDFGRLNWKWDDRTGETIVLYNEADQITGIVTPSPDGNQPPHVTTLSFDNMGRVWKTTLPDNTSITNEFYFTGELKRRYGSRVYPVAYSYDYAGRMKTMTNWSGFPNSGVRFTTWHYDGFRGFLTNKSYDGDAAGPFYTYTPAGRLYTRTWARGVIATNTYNAAGLLQMIAYSSGTPGIVYTYNRRGLPVTVTQGAKSCSYDYNALHQLVAERTTGGPLDGVVITNSYDHLLRRTNITAHLGDTPLTRTVYSYDAASRLESVSAGVHSVTYSYLPDWPLLKNISFRENGLSRLETSKTYDLLDRVTATSSTNSQSGRAASASYAYNSANLRTAIARDDSHWIYQYDALGQVISGKNYWTDGMPVGGQHFEYGFDEIGNRTQTAAGGNSSGLELRAASYSANGLNQYADRQVPGFMSVVGTANSNAIVTLWTSPTVAVSNSIGYFPTTRKGDYYYGELMLSNSGTALWFTLTNLAILPNGTNTDIIAAEFGNVFLPGTPESFSYDADGNLIDDGRWTYAWDAENRLISMTSLNNTDSKLKLEFAYDHQGRRIQKVVSAWNGSAYVTQSTTKFVYDGAHLLATLNDQSSLLQSFTWGADLSSTPGGAGGVGGLLLINDATQGSHFVASDGNGNVDALVNAADGSISASYEYGPFGELIRSTGPMAKANPWRFSTKYQDIETDLLYYGYRYYHPSTGRWLSRDPLEEQGGLNLYAFLDNDPVNFFDFDGREKGAEALVRLARNGPSAHGDMPVDVWLRLTLGWPFNVLSGDMFRPVEKTKVQLGRCNVVITVNGIWNREPHRQGLNDAAKNSTRYAGAQPLLSVNYTTYVGDLLQILGDELGAIQTSSIRLAKQINTIHDQLKKNGCCCGQIQVLGHSQGTMVFRQAWSLITPGARKLISFTGVGGETTIQGDYGLAAQENYGSSRDWVPVLGNFNPLRILTWPTTGIPSWIKTKSPDSSWFEHSYDPHYKTHVNSLKPNAPCVPIKQQ